jgi:hypothetical protein
MQVTVEHLLTVLMMEMMTMITSEEALMMMMRCLHVVEGCASGAEAASAA